MTVVRFPTTIELYYRGPVADFTPKMVELGYTFGSDTFCWRDDDRTKTRADIRAMTWRFHDSDRDRVKIHGEWLDTHQRARTQREAEKSAPLVNLLVKVFRSPGEELSIKEIAERAQEIQPDLTRKVITTALRKHEGERWTVRTGLHNRQLHKLINTLDT